MVLECSSIHSQPRHSCTNASEFTLSMLTSAPHLVVTKTRLVLAYIWGSSNFCHTIGQMASSSCSQRILVGMWKFWWPLVSSLATVSATAPPSLLVPPPPPPPPSTFVVHVDISLSVASPFDFAYGVDHGPLCDSGVDVASELLQFGSMLVRTHDSGVLDWPVNTFPPSTDWHCELHHVDSCGTTSSH